uniref:Uncharacterized protein n=1 Tax=Vitrella brassicaformis TaxID=1169539 RepID=A0A7S1JLZ0_9ALVE
MSLFRTFMTHTDIHTARQTDRQARPRPACRFSSFVRWLSLSHSLPSFVPSQTSRPFWILWPVQSAVWDPIFVRLVMSMNGWLALCVCRPAVSADKQTGSGCGAAVAYWQEGSVAPTDRSVRWAGDICTYDDPQDGLID